MSSRDDIVTLAEDCGVVIVCSAGVDASFKLRRGGSVWGCVVRAVRAWVSHTAETKRDWRLKGCANRTLHQINDGTWIFNLCLPERVDVIASSSRQTRIFLNRERQETFLFALGKNRNDLDGSRLVDPQAFSA